MLRFLFYLHRDLLFLYENNWKLESEQGQVYLLPWLETTLHVFRLLQDTVGYCVFLLK
jgi:hypothetical protein